MTTTNRDEPCFLVFYESPHELGLARLVKKNFKSYEEASLHLKDLIYKEVGKGGFIIEAKEKCTKELFKERETHDNEVDRPSI